MSYALNHKKIIHPLTHIEHVPRVQLYQVTPIAVDGLTYKDEPLTKQCTAGCWLEAVTAEEACVLVRISKKYFRVFNVNQEVMAKPGFDPLEAVYCAGVGNMSSMMRYKNEWWIVYAVLYRVIDECKKRVIVLHNVQVQWESGPVDTLVQKALQDLATFR